MHWEVVQFGKKNYVGLEYAYISQMGWQKIKLKMIFVK